MHKVAQVLLTNLERDVCETYVYITFPLINCSLKEWEVIYFLFVQTFYKHFLLLPANIIREL